LLAVSSAPKVEISPRVPKNVRSAFEDFRLDSLPPVAGGGSGGKGNLGAVSAPRDCNRRR
jgi:hypothetical protein